jgi:hypothetical protein
MLCLERNRTCSVNPQLCSHTSRVSTAAAVSVLGAVSSGGLTRQRVSPISLLWMRPFVLHDIAALEFVFDGFCVT